MNDIIEKIRNMYVPSVSAFSDEYTEGYTEGRQHMLDDVVALLEEEQSQIEAQRGAQSKFLKSYFARGPGPELKEITK